jgi:hypothetical protein
MKKNILATDKDASEWNENEEEDQILILTQQT